MWTSRSVSVSLCLINSLITTALFDREFHCRRSAAVALRKIILSLKDLKETSKQPQQQHHFGSLFFSDILSHVNPSNLSSSCESYLNVSTGIAKDPQQRYHCCCTSTFCLFVCCDGPATLKYSVTILLMNIYFLFPRQVKSVT